MITEKMRLRKWNKVHVVTKDFMYKYKNINIYLGTRDCRNKKVLKIIVITIFDLIQL